VATTDASGVSTIVVYSGPNGTGIIISKDIEHTDNTSGIITYGPNGPTDDTTYSGPEGTGIPGAKVVTVYNGTNHAAVQFDQSDVVFAAGRVGDQPRGVEVTVRLLSGDGGSLSGLSGGTPGIGGGPSVGVSSSHPTGLLGISFGGVGVAAGDYTDIIIPVSVEIENSSTETTLAGSAKVYEPAQETASIQPVPHIFHVGATASVDVSITNTATGDLTDSLHTVFLGSTGGVTLTNTDPLANLAGGQSGTIAINVDTSKAGDFSIDSNLFHFSAKTRTCLTCLFFQRSGLRRDQ
jgi:hypothetical protein